MDLKAKQLENQENKKEKEEIISEYYLSSIYINEENNINYLEGLEEDNPRSAQAIVRERMNKVKERIFKFCLFLVEMIIFLLSYLLYIVPITAIKSIIGIGSSIIRLDSKKLSNFFIAFTNCPSVLYSIIIYFFFPFQSLSGQYLLQDCIFFYLTQILIFSYIQAVRIEAKSFCEIMQLAVSEQAFNTLQIQLSQEQNENAFYFDFKTKLEKLYSNNKMNLVGVPNISQNFSYFSLNGKNSQLSYPFTTLFQGFDSYMNPNIRGIMVLTTLLYLKISVCIYFLDYHNLYTFSFKVRLDFLISFLLALNTVISLNRILGNLDLIRKTKAIKQLRDAIDFENISENNYFEKIDITCPISQETWDNTRKCIFNIDQEFLEQLELSYFCFLFYYIFSLLVIFSAYFEWNWIFAKESYLMHPMIVLQSTFNFIFLSGFLFLRFWWGSQLNGSFDELQQSLDYLIDVVEDLQTMFDQFFRYDEQSMSRITKENKISPYGLIIKRIKLLSKNHIDNKIKYQGILYSRNQKSQLRMQIILNMKISLKKLKKSIIVDKDKYKYRFLNLLEIDFNDFLITTIIAIVTTLPTIIPKFIEIYKSEPK